MSFNASSYLAGVGTVAVVLALGFGAGMQMTGMLEQTQGGAASTPNKLERRVAEQAAADEAKAREAQPVATKPLDDTKTAAEAAIRTGTASVPVHAPSLSAPNSVEPRMPAQRMREAFSGQPPASQPPEPSLQAPAASKAPAPSKAASAVQSGPIASPPQEAIAMARETDLDKARLDTMRLAAEQKKALQKKLAADRRRQHEARLNAATEWVRRQPFDIANPPRVVSRGFFLD